MGATEGFMKAQIEQLKEENKKLKEYWSIEINTCNRYREKSEELEKELKLLQAKYDLILKLYNELEDKLEDNELKKI